MRRSFYQVFRRCRRFALPLVAALMFFDVWVSWHLQLPTPGFTVGLAAWVFAWVLLDSLDRDDA